METSWGQGHLAQNIDFPLAGKLTEWKLTISLIFQDIHGSFPLAGKLTE